MENPNIQDDKLIEIETLYEEGQLTWQDYQIELAKIAIELEKQTKLNEEF